MFIFKKYSSVFHQLTGKIDNLKIGILKEGFGLKDSEADVDKMVREAAGQLAAKCGAVVEEVSIPMHSDGNGLFLPCNILVLINHSSPSYVCKTKVE